MVAKSLEVGVCSWSLKVSSIPELVKLLGRVEAVAVQLALGDPHHATWVEKDGFVPAAKGASFDITATMIGFPGEDYSTPESIKRTGGFGESRSRKERLQIFKWAVDRTRELGVEILSTHAGFIPPPSDPGRMAFLDALGEAVDYAASKDIILAMETGQETAELLRRTIDEMEAPNLKVNFDPANMLLYNMGDPIRAVEVLGNDIAHVHVKDAIPPTKPGEWGVEVPIGEGKVGLKNFLDTLVRVGYSGPLVVEREVGDQEVRIRDIASGVQAIRKTLAQI